jgi:hypothetical protein
LQRELRVRNGYEKDANTKNQHVIKMLEKQLHDSIENIMPKKEQLCQEQEKDIIRKFNSELIKMKKKLEEQKSYKGDQEADKKERENEIQHNLELITSIAQRIDNENRLLIKKNAELK